MLPCSMAVMKDANFHKEILTTSCQLSPPPPPSAHALGTQIKRKEYLVGEGKDDSGKILPYCLS